MTKTTSEMADRMDEGLAMLWYQVDRIGDRELREEIEDSLSQKLGSGEWNLVRCTFEATSTKERWRCRFEIWTENRCGCCPRLLTICCR